MCLCVKKQRAVSKDLSYTWMATSLQWTIVAASHLNSPVFLTAKASYIPPWNNNSECWYPWALRISKIVNICTWNGQFWGFWTKMKMFKLTASSYNFALCGSVAQQQKKPNQHPALLISLAENGVISPWQVSKKQKRNMLLFCLSSKAHSLYNCSTKGLKSLFI